MKSRQVRPQSFILLFSPSDNSNHVPAKYLVLGNDKGGRPVVAFRSGRHLPGRVPTEVSMKCAHFLIHQAFERCGFAVLDSTSPSLLKRLSRSLQDGRRR